MNIIQKIESIKNFFTSEQKPFSLEDMINELVRAYIFTLHNNKDRSFWTDEYGENKILFKERLTALNLTSTTIPLEKRFNQEQMALQLEQNGVTALQEIVITAIHFGMEQQARLINKKFKEFNI